MSKESTHCWGSQQVAPKYAICSTDYSELELLGKQPVGGNDIKKKPMLTSLFPPLPPPAQQQDINLLRESIFAAPGG